MKPKQKKNKGIKAIKAYAVIDLSINHFVSDGSNQIAIHFTKSNCVSWGRQMIGVGGFKIIPVLITPLKTKKK